MDSGVNAAESPVIAGFRACESCSKSDGVFAWRLDGASGVCKTHTLSQDFGHLRPECQWRAGLTLDKLINEMDKALQFPGVSNAWTMPIKARIDMLATGIRTPVGVKVLGQDLSVIERLAREIEVAIKSVPGTASAFAERIIGGYYLEVAPDRRQLARHGLMVGDVQQVIASAMGGGNRDDDRRGTRALYGEPALPA